VGRKRVIVAAAFLLSVATFAAAAAPTLGALIAARFVQGLCVPAITGTTIAYITEELRGPHVASVMSMYVSGTVIGGFLGRFVTGVASATWGWRSAFVLLGGATLVAAAVIWWLLPRARQFQRQPHLAASLRTMARHLRNPQLMATCAVGFGVLFGLVGTFTYVGFHLAAEPYRLGSVALGSVFAVYLLGVIVTPLAGRVMHVIGYRRAVALALTVSASGLSLTLAPWLWLKIAGLALVAAGIFVAHAAAASHIAVAVTAGRSSAVGLYVALYYAGGSAGSVIPGLLWRTAGWPGTVAVVLAVQLIAAMTALWSWREPARP
jgi:predicted MFS family arabinose efflux permease